MKNKLINRNILLIISGGIAAYKALDLIRRLRDEGAKVKSILTAGGAQFITPLSIAALSQEKVYTDLWSLDDEQGMGHIQLARQSDLILVVPASANLLAKMAHGIADDLASTMLLANNKPVMVAPAMNVVMWNSQPTQKNQEVLIRRGVKILGPAVGEMACGEEGEGRLLDVSEIVQAVFEHFTVLGPLAGKKALVTSGPTFEPIDPVRFLGNRSSGKQGHAIAASLQSLGAETLLITGPTSLGDPLGVATFHVETAREMMQICENNLPVDIAVCAAAVSDWRPVQASLQKMKKSETAPSFELVENPDILATLSRNGDHRPKLVVGFAAETENLLQNAQEKLRKKNCDWLLANEVGTSKAFAEDHNKILFLRYDSEKNIIQENWPHQSKVMVARQLADRIVSSFMPNGVKE